jgi:magnesium transporter
MISNLINNQEFTWVDVVMPTEHELMEIANAFAIPPQYARTCLDPEHFPRYQEIDNGTIYIMLRNFDSDSLPQADTVREITQKLAIFYGKNFLVTVHRREQKLFHNFCLHFQEKIGGHLSIARIVDKIVSNAVTSYEQPIEATAELVDKYEEQIFLKNANSHMIQELFFIKRRMSLTKRMLDLTHEVAQTLPDVNPDDKWHEPVYLSEKLLFRNDQVLEMANSLMNLHLALESHRTNEVMRILTLFSVFFMPLTFIAGVYGMNFAYMPELQSPWGYPLTLLSMLLTGVGLFFWFKRKKWIRSS